ncbi:MAG TPA: hypothetical protein GXZ47_06545 [Treponema sp.]|nr:hypothetical protein [Treponema sp.]
MKKLCGFLFCVCCACGLFCQTAGKIEVSKIRIYCDEAAYLWTSDGIERIDEGSAEVVLKVETILTFLSIKPGFYGTEKEILKHCYDSERRMTDSGYFYESTIMVVPPKKNLTERTLVLTLSSGYLMRYSGGNAWGMYGAVGLGGERQSLYGYAGYNKNGFRYMYSHFAGSPLSFGGSLFYYGPGEYSGKCDTEKKANRFSGSVILQGALTPDLTIGIEPVVDGFGFSFSGYFSLQPFFTKKKYISFGSESELGIDVRGFWYPVVEVVKAETSGYFRFGITPKVTVAVKGSLGVSPFDLPGPTTFDLYYTEDRTIRSGYSFNDLSFSNFAFASAELRYDFFEYRIPPMFDVGMQVFAFTDIARSPHSLMEMGDLVHLGKGSLEVFDAYGIGLRILFNNPVFAYFTLSYGINHHGDGRFLFCGTAGY